MELTALRLEVRERLGELVADFWTDVEVDRAINEGVRRFCAEEPWPFLVTEWDSSLAADDNELDLPSNVSLTRVFNIAVDGGSLTRPRPLTRVDAKEGFQLRFDYDGRTGVPRWYYISRSNLVAEGDEEPPIIYTAKVIPTPDVAYDVEGQYMMVPTDLSTATDEPPIPYEYQEAVAAWATGKLFLKEQMVSQKSSEQFQLYQMVVNQAKNDLQSFSQDEIVSLGRREPLLRNSYYGDPRTRIYPTLG